TVSDGMGAETEASMTVVVNDTELPVITDNGDQTVNNDTGFCGALVTVSASATDNCSVDGEPVAVRSDGLALDARYPVGTTTITCPIEYIDSNAAVAETKTIVVNDTELPVITDNGDQTVNNDT